MSTHAHASRLICMGLDRNSDRPINLSPSTTNTIPSGTSRDVFIIFIFYPRVHTHKKPLFRGILLCGQRLAPGTTQTSPVISIGAWGHGAGEYKYTKQKKGRFALVAHSEVYERRRRSHPVPQSSLAALCASVLWAPINNAAAEFSD